MDLKQNLPLVYNGISSGARPFYMIQFTTLLLCFLFYKSFSVLVQNHNVNQQSTPIVAEI